jgi:hypothetical protein
MVVSNETGRSPEQTTAMESLVRRVASAPQLQGSPKLREFFLYVVDCALRGVPEEATEQHIGVHVFHRPAGYNSGDDSIVRSQARLLRAKLAAYFAGEGIHEPVIIEIPKGQYLPVFRDASEAVDPVATAASEAAKAAAISAGADDHGTASVSAALMALQEHSAVQARTILSAALCVLIALAIGGAAGYIWRGHANYPATPELDTFWKPFYGSDDALVIYSNPAFVGTPANGLRLLEYATPAAAGDASAPPPNVDESYTGTGEAAAIHNLTELFGAHGSRFTLKRSRLVTWDEARSRSLLFVGAPSQNTALNDLQTLTQFRIAETPEHRGYIVDAHPHPGEPPSFPLQSPTEETAIVALLPGLQPDTRIAIFCGLSTLGTQEAVEFFTQPSTARTLIDRVGIANGILKPFEAVLKINRSKGVAMGASFAAIHRE